LFDFTIHALKTSLNLRTLKHNILCSNISNENTPGYQAKKVEFETQLRDALHLENRLPKFGTHTDHFIFTQLDAIHPNVYEDPYGNPSLNGNTVNRTAEMAELTENQLLYETSLELLKKKISLLKYAISEGERSH